jgi:hypothetical protein
LREKTAKPLKLSNDWDNNLYRNVVHVLVESEGIIPGGQAERVISIVKALISEEIKKGLLTDEERQACIYKVSTSPAPYAFTDADGTLINPEIYSIVDTKKLAQAQLDKILSLLRA